jgi:hypothetical protein
LSVDSLWIKQQWPDLFQNGIVKRPIRLLTHGGSTLLKA